MLAVLKLTIKATSTMPIVLPLLVSEDGESQCVHLHILSGAIEQGEPVELPVESVHRTVDVDIVVHGFSIVTHETCTQELLLSGYSVLQRVSAPLLRSNHHLGKTWSQQHV